MNEEKKNKIKRILKVIWLIYANLSVVILLPKVDQLFCEEYSKVSQHISLNEHWDIRINEK